MVPEAAAGIDMLPAESSAHPRSDRECAANSNYVAVKTDSVIWASAKLSTRVQQIRFTTAAQGLGRPPVPVSVIRKRV